eukprot:COSAG05_NODE_653_length_8071_cov_220.994982_8_plen_105_part_00
MLADLKCVALCLCFPIWFMHLLCTLFAACVAAFLVAREFSMRFNLNPPMCALFVMSMISFTLSVSFCSVAFLCSPCTSPLRAVVLVVDRLLSQVPSLISCLSVR